MFWEGVIKLLMSACIDVNLTHTFTSWSPVDNTFCPRV